MPLLSRVSALLMLTVATMAAQESPANAMVGDNGNWAAVGAILTGLSYGSAKLLDRMRR